MESELIKWIGGIFNGVIANAIYDRIKLFAKEKPDEYEQNDIDAFKAYLYATNHNEITLKLDDLLTVLQQNKDAVTGQSLTLKEILGSSKSIEGILSQILEHIRRKEEPNKPEIEFKLGCVIRGLDCEQKPFSGLQFRFKPLFKNIGLRAIKEFGCEIQVNSEIIALAISQTGGKAIRTPLLERSSVSLMGGETFETSSVIAFNVGLNTIEKFKASSIKLIFRWDGGVEENTFELRKYAYCNGEGLQIKDFKIPEADEQKRRAPRKPNPYTEGL